jgi:hypothetical protein
MTDIKKLFHSAYEKYLAKVNEWNQMIEQMPLKQRLELIVYCITGGKDGEQE